MASFYLEINENNGKSIMKDLTEHISQKFGNGIVKVTIIQNTNDGQFIDEECYRKHR